MSSPAFNAAFANWRNPMQFALKGNYSSPGYASGGGVDPGFRAPEIAMGGGEGGGLFSGTSFGDKAGLAIGGLQALSNLWMGIQSLNLAKKDLSFRKDAFNTNLANQVASYNTSLEDRIKSRAHTEGRAPGYADGYLDKHKLKERQVA